MIYAISIEIDETKAGKSACADIDRALASVGFVGRQGCIFYGNKSTNAVDCVLAAQMLARTFEWFKESVLDIKMLRIDEISDLSEAL